MPKVQRAFGIMTFDAYRRIEIIFAGISRKTGEWKEAARTVAEAVQSDFLMEVVGEAEDVIEHLARVFPEFVRVDARIVALFEKLPEKVRLSGVSLLPERAMRRAIAELDPNADVRDLATKSANWGERFSPENLLERMDDDPKNREMLLIFLFFAAVEAAHHANHEAKLEAMRELVRRDKKSPAPAAA